MESIGQILGKNIRAARKSLGLSQAELASDVKMTVQAINRIEKGKSLPRGPNLEAIAAALECTVEELYRAFETPRPTPPEVLEEMAQTTVSPEILEAIERGAARVIARRQDELSALKQKLINLIPLIDDDVIADLLPALEARIANKRQDDGSTR